jgi:hypothetical protein
MARLALTPFQWKSAQIVDALHVVLIFAFLKSLDSARKWSDGVMEYWQKGIAFRKARMEDGGWQSATTLNLKLQT